MITAADLEGKDIPVSGICPICFELNHHNDHVWKQLRGHLVQSHGLTPLTDSERVKACIKRNREKYNEQQRVYQQKYKKRRYIETREKRINRKNRQVAKE